MPKNDPDVTLSVGDFEVDAEGNLRIKTGQLAEELLRLLMQARTGAPLQKSPKGPKVKVEM
jgi:hypothetical protein